MQRKEVTLIFKPCNVFKRQMLKNIRALLSTQYFGVQYFFCFNFFRAFLYVDLSVTYPV